MVQDCDRASVKSFASIQAASRQHFSQKKEFKTAKLAIRKIRRPLSRNTTFIFIDINRKKLFL